MLPWETDPGRYRELFHEKCDRVEARFGALKAPVAERYASPPEGYRIRAEFRMWHDDDALNFVMFDPADRRTPVSVTDFAPAITPIRSLMEPLRQRLQGTPTLRRKLFQVEFLASRNGEAVVTLIYHRPLDEQWQQVATQLGTELAV